MIEQQNNKVKTEQIVMQRQIKLVWGGEYVEVYNHTTNRLYCEDTWTDLIDERTKYDLKQLMLAGYKVVSVNKSWAISKDCVSFGFETMILEREIKI